MCEGGSSGEIQLVRRVTGRKEQSRRGRVKGVVVTRCRCKGGRLTLILYNRIITSMSPEDGYFLRFRLGHLPISCHAFFLKRSKRKEFVEIG